jgi:hypothetical protein
MECLIVEGYAAFECCGFNNNVDHEYGSHRMSEKGRRVAGSVNNRTVKAEKLS